MTISFIHQSLLHCTTGGNFWQLEFYLQALSVDLSAQYNN